MYKDNGTIFCVLCCMWRDVAENLETWTTALEIVALYCEPALNTVFPSSFLLLPVLLAYVVFLLFLGFFNMLRVSWDDSKRNQLFFLQLNIMWHWNWFFSIEVSSSSWDPNRRSGEKRDRQCILTHNLEITQYRRSIFVSCVLVITQLNELIDYSLAVISWFWS